MDAKATYKTTYSVLEKIQKDYIHTTDTCHGSKTQSSIFRIRSLHIHKQDMRTCHDLGSRKDGKHERTPVFNLDLLYGAWACQHRGSKLGPSTNTERMLGPQYIDNLGTSALLECCEQSDCK